MHESGPKPDVPPQRLCSEVQLFDLCDLDTCVCKNGRFCTDPALLDRFEKIAEEELRTPDRYAFEESDDAESEDSDGYGYGDEAAMEEFEGSEDDGREDEE